MEPKRVFDVVARVGQQLGHTHNTYTVRGDPSSVPWAQQKAEVLARPEASPLHAHVDLKRLGDGLRNLGYLVEERESSIGNYPNPLLRCLLIRPFPNEAPRPLAVGDVRVDADGTLYWLLGDKVDTDPAMERVFLCQVSWPDGESRKDVSEAWLLAFTRPATDATQPTIPPSALNVLRRAMVNGTVLEVSPATYSRLRYTAEDGRRYLITVEADDAPAR